MKTGKGSVILGLGVASAAALAFSAPAASAAPVSSPAYLSTASATAGSLNFGTGPAGPPNTSTATDASPSVGTTTGISHGDLPNGLGTIVTTNDADLLTTHAQVFPNGTSTACSAAASGACGGQGSAPLDIRLNLQRILQVGNSVVGSDQVPISDIADALPGYSLVLGITGPAATCTAGPAVGSPGSAFTISRTVVSGTVDLQNGTRSVIGGPKTIGTNGDFLVPLIVNAVNPALAKIPNADVKLSFTPGTDSGAGVGPSTSAEVGKLVVTVNGITVATFTGGKVSCGPNQLESPPVASSSSSHSSGSSGGAVSSSSSSSAGSADGSGGQGMPAGTRPGLAPNTPAIALVSDHAAESHYALASNDTPLGGLAPWAGLIAGGVALGGGLVLRRRRGRA